MRCASRILPLLLLTALCVCASNCNSCQRATPKPFNVKRIGSGVETTVAVVPTGPKTRNYVIGFMGEGASWAVSSDQGANWTLHSESDPNFRWGKADGQSEWTYGTDPTLVTTGHPNQVAFVSMASAREVAIAISTDGGHHFGNVHLVSSPADGRGNDPEPVATLNANTGQIWVAWTQKPGPRLFVRALHYDQNGTLFFDTNPIDVRGLPGLTNFGPTEEINMTIAAGSFEGKSHVAIAYADKYDPYYGGPTCPGTLDLKYYLADSTDGGQTWQSIEVARDRVWPLCATDQPTYNRNRPAVAFAGGVYINYYMAVTKSSPTGSLVVLYRVQWPFQQGSVHEFGTTLPPDRRRHDQFGPAIAVGYTTPDVSASDRNTLNIMVTWHDTRTDPNGANLQQVVYGSVWGLFSWDGVMSPAVGIANEHVPWTLQGWWGDYEGLAADDFSHSFVGAWADNRIDGSPVVWSGVLSPL